MKIFNDAVKQLLADQVAGWSLARENYKELKNISTRELKFDNNITIKIHLNPKRAKSSTAKVDEASIKQRECFLCECNLPPEQDILPFGNSYNLLVNPFPIFEEHLTIASSQHVHQKIYGNFDTMLLLAREISSFLIFYNGPACGASAPDHLHFQAGGLGLLPIEAEFDLIDRTIAWSKNESIVYTIDNYLRNTIVITGNNHEEISELFNQLHHILAIHLPSDPEPMMNIIVYYIDGYWRVYIFPRRQHRPACFFANDPDKIEVSPASVDFGGVITIHRKEDFNKLNEQVVHDIFSQLTVDTERWVAIKAAIKNLMAKN